jgi:hypothetical protein
MFLTFDAQLSDSVFVERVWRCHSDRAGRFLSIAASNFEIAVTRHGGRAFVTMRGPETKATTADCPAEGEWLGIRFKLGTFMPHLPPGTLCDSLSAACHFDPGCGAADRISGWCGRDARACREPAPEPHALSHRRWADPVGRLVSSRVAFARAAAVAAVERIRDSGRGAVPEDDVAVAEAS